MDTTYRLCNLWLTDTLWENLRLLNADGKHPWFPGPILLHFQKKNDTFKKFYLEMIQMNSGLMELKTLGTDRERAFYLGFKEVNKSLLNLLYHRIYVGH